MTSGYFFVFRAVLGSSRLHALRQFTEALKMITHFLRAGGLWTLSSGGLFGEITPGLDEFPTFFYVKLDSRS